jgi:hypothetical protein
VTRALRLGGAAVLLAGPVAIAFFTGGYTELPRLWAGLGAWALVVLGALVVPRPLPQGRAARVALAATVALALWTLLSTAWAPVAGDAWHAGQLALLYAGTLVAAAALLRGVDVELALLGGALIVIGYAIAERLLPGLLRYHHSLSAGGRLEQPLTYWNALGELAAFGFVLAARVTGDARRPAVLRAAAAAAAAPLGLGLYLTVSRGALWAAAAGLLTLLVASRTRQTLRGILLALAAGGLATASAAPFGGVTGFHGTLAQRETQGVVVLCALVVIATAAVLVATRPPAPGTLRLPRHAAWIALGVVVAGFALALAVGAKEKGSALLSTGAGRYTTFESNRYAYWRVAARAFADAPVQGVGAGGWAVYWRRDRTFGEGAHDAHSLYFQTAAELGLVGVALLAAAIAGVVLTTRRAVREAPEAAAGLAAAGAVWLAHVALDWDWQMPAATLPALLAAGALLTAPRRSAAPRD